MRATRRARPAVIRRPVAKHAAKREPITATKNRSLDVEALARLAALKQADPELSALYRRFLAAAAKAAEADTPETQKGSLNSGTPKQKRLHATWERRMSAADAIFHEIMSAPARTIEGALLKIHVRGWHDETRTSGYTPLIGAPDWQLRGSAFRDYQTVLLDSLRSDLRRIRSTPDKLADQLELAIADHFTAFMKWAPIAVAAGAAVDVRFPNWHLSAAVNPARYAAALALRRKITAKHVLHEHNLNRAHARGDHLVERIKERKALGAGDLRARVLVMLHECRPGAFDHEGALSFPDDDDGGAARLLFECAADCVNLGALVRSYEKALRENAALINQQRATARRHYARKGGAK